MPLYSGGGVDASVKQSEADRSRAEEDIRVERENLEIEVQRQYQAVVGGTSRIAAYRKAVDSSELALQGARRSLASGLATGSEVAEAQARHFSARRELAQARFEYLLARLRLMVNSGAPAADVAADLDRALTASPVAPPALTR